MLDKLLDFAPNLGLDALLLLPVLIALEAVLSADNAIALAAIAQGLDSQKMQRNALNVGLVAAFVLRIVLILTATWVINFWQFELLGALYLLWLVFEYFKSNKDEDSHHHGPLFASIWQAIPMIAVTDLAFSLDSVTTAIALSQEKWLVITGGMIGVITLRFMAGLFIQWLDEYEHLEDAGFITVGLVGLRLLVRVINPDFVPPEWVMVSVISILFVWGFSKRTSDSQNASMTDDTLLNNGQALGNETASSLETDNQSEIDHHLSNGMTLKSNHDHEVNGSESSGATSEIVKVPVLSLNGNGGSSDKADTESGDRSPKDTPIEQTE